MKKIGLLLCLTGFLAGQLSAQIVLRGKISNILPSALQVAMVDYWAVDHWQQLAILQLEGGAFTANVNPPAQAQCRIRMAGQMKVWSDFILPGPGNKTDTLLVFDLDVKAMNGGPTRVTGSSESEPYFTLMTAYQQLNHMRDSSSTTPAAQREEAERTLNQLCLETAKKYPGSFTGDIVANLLYQPQKADYPKDTKVAGMTANEFVIAHALDKVPFRYDRVLYHNGFAKALNRYYNYFDSKTADGGKNYIEGIMARRNGSDAVDLFVFRFLLDKMMENKDEAGLHHLLTWYLPDCSDESPLPDNTLTLVKALQNCDPGKIIPEMTFPDADGANISLNDVCAKNKITLLFFWRSNCSHCKEFKPVLAGIYEKYHPRGVEVLALSLDKMDTGWKETLQKEPTKWVNGFVPNDRRGDINRQFPIPSTPTLIALDANRKVLSRLVLREQLEAYLEETLQKMGAK